MNREEWEKTHREDFYLAQIACEIRRGQVKNPNLVKLEAFLLKFVTKGAKAEPVTQEALDKRTAASKATWGGILAASMAKRPPGATGKPKGTTPAAPVAPVRRKRG